MGKNHKSKDIENHKKKMNPKILEEEYSHELGDVHAGKFFELIQVGKLKDKKKSDCKDKQNGR
ncbi:MULTISPECIES: hypothetical protein [Bacillus]|uniref:Uncharacterized protein n=2 Tax=Bacillus TaxID=1386 RepID=A0A0M4FPJ8_9BACI|nr:MULTISPECIES: hypothetical protein [Bacillus]ALC80847.1 hypothetical protein AM592_04040 [Bacillus gobiensis]MBP1079777.1 hypothetical protein [Bacillus capparidis]MED1095169.1 hypothetical protein [Bacillus capparidis]